MIIDSHYSEMEIDVFPTQLLTSIVIATVKEKVYLSLKLLGSLLSAIIIIASLTKKCLQLSVILVSVVRIPFLASALAVKVKVKLEAIRCWFKVESSGKKNLLIDPHVAPKKPKDRLSSLPMEIQLQILKQMTVKSAITLSSTNLFWSHLVYTDCSLWKYYLKRDFNFTSPPNTREIHRLSPTHISNRLSLQKTFLLHSYQLRFLTYTKLQKYLCGGRVSAMFGFISDNPEEILAYETLKSLEFLDYLFISVLKVATLTIISPLNWIFCHIYGVVPFPASSATFSTSLQDAIKELLHLTLTHRRKLAKSIKSGRNLDVIYQCSISILQTLITVSLVAIDLTSQFTSFISIKAIEIASLVLNGRLLTLAIQLIQLSLLLAPTLSYVVWSTKRFESMTAFDPPEKAIEKVYIMLLDPLLTFPAIQITWIATVFFSTHERIRQSLQSRLLFQDHAVSMFPMGFCLAIVKTLVVIFQIGISMVLSSWILSIAIHI